MSASDNSLIFNKSIYMSQKKFLSKFTNFEFFTILSQSQSVFFIKLIEDWRKIRAILRAWLGLAGIQRFVMPHGQSSKKAKNPKYKNF